MKALKRWQNLAALLMAMIASMTASSAIAQVSPATPADPVLDGPQITDPAKLPIISKLKTLDPAWSDIDTDIAIAMIRRYVTDHPGQGLPLDCDFKLSRPHRHKYEDGENFSTVQREPRMHQDPVVAFSQLGIWKEFPKDAKKFSTADEDNAEWKQFKAEVLPTIETEISRAYQGTVPASLRVLVLRGYVNTCVDIQNYLYNRFQVSPAFVHCIDSAQYDQKLEEIKTSNTSFLHNFNTGYNNSHWETYNKISDPYAKGYQYRDITITGCTFPDLSEPKEKKLKREKDDQSALKAAAKLAKQQEHDVEQKKKTELKAQAQKQKADDKAQAAKEKAEYKAAELAAAEQVKLQKKWEQDAIPKMAFPTTNKDLPEVVATTDGGRKLIKGYHELHHDKWTNNNQFSIDEKKLTALTDTIRKGESDFLKKTSEQYNQYFYDLKSVELDSKTPFDMVSIPVELPLNSDEMDSLLQHIQKEHLDWLYGCRPRSETIKDHQGRTMATQTWLDCLTPNFSLHIRNENAQGAMISLPYPALVGVVSEVRNHCGITTGAHTGTGLGIGWVDLFHLPARKNGTASSSIAYKSKTIPEEFPLYTSIKGSVFDLFTKKPIANAQVVIKARENYSAKTNSSGQYVVEDIRPKNLDREAHGSHPLYHDGSSLIGKIVIDGMSVADDMFLDPLRAEFSGHITETQHSRFGTGLGGMKVYIDGYPDLFAVTDKDGYYKLGSVPAYFTAARVSDPLNGHQSKTFPIKLDWKTPSEGNDTQVVTNLTEIHGVVRSSKGDIAKGVKVSVVGFPEINITVGETGEYKLSDIPVHAQLKVDPDDEDNFNGKIDSLEGFVPFIDNNHDIIVYPHADVSGRAYDVITKQGVAGVKVWIEGTGGTRFSTVTDAQGNYTIKRIPGNARRLDVLVADKKYIARNRDINPLPNDGNDVFHQDFRLMPSDYTKDKIVFLLTWNEHQYDLDSQLFFPNNRHLYFKTLSAGNFDAEGGFLDRDDTGNSGRETTIISLVNGTTKVPGDYRFLVYEYQDQHLTFQQADALVEVYRDGEFWQEIKPGKGRGRLWYVANVAGQDLKIMNKFPGGDLYAKIDKLNYEQVDVKKDLAEDTRLLADNKSEFAKIIALPATTPAELQEIDDRLLRLANEVLPLDEFEPVATVHAAIRTTAPARPSNGPATLPGAVPGPAVAPPAPTGPSAADLNKQIAKIKGKIGPALDKAQQDIDSRAAHIDQRAAEIPIEIEKLEHRLEELLQTYQ